VPTDETLDPAVVAELRRAQEDFGNPEFIQELVGLFRTRTPEKLDRIRRALDAGDAVAVREVAHSLRSNCGMLGAMAMSGACARMEDAAARGDLAAAGEAFQEAEQHLPLVLEALSALM
jgi:HPt (histidine-containing phosphotransfer) domain-containing protein